MAAAVTIDQWIRLFTAFRKQSSNGLDAGQRRQSFQDCR
jgi:hypothetical protein